MDDNTAENRPMSISRRWLIMYVALVVGMLLTSLISSIVMRISPGNVGLLVVQVLQNILAFVLPAVFVAAMARRALLADTRRWSPELSLDRPLSSGWVALVLLTYVVSLPAMNWLVAWNESLHPVVFESWFRWLEDNAQAITAQLLDIDQWWQLVVIVLVVGVVTGIGEEFFFRGGLLNPVLRCGRWRHLTIWIVALIFSASHLQFYGFVPRMLLGAWFGYLLLWSRSLWVPILAHALNNSMVVVATYLGNKGLVDAKMLDTVGTSGSFWYPWLPVASAVLWLGIWFFLHKKFGKSKLLLKENY